MDIKIATNIETDIFYSIISFLKKNNWKLIVEYCHEVYDKGVDFDLYKFSRDRETILLVWDNWSEGEVKATTKTLNEISKHFKIILKFGKPEYLHKPDIIDEMKNLLSFHDDSKQHNI